MVLNLYFIGFVAGAVVLAYFIGMALPSRYFVSSVLILQVPSRCIWNRIVKFQKYHKWRKDLKFVKVLSGNEWMETDQNNDQISYSMAILEDKSKVRIDVTSNNLVYKRSWIIHIHSVGKLCIIRITEDGEVFEPFFRTFGKYIFGFHTPAKRYLRNLENAYKKRLEPQVLIKTIHIFDVLNLRQIIQPFIKTNRSHRPYFSFE